LTLSANYTYSHALDLVSNGGLEGFNYTSYYPIEQMSPAGASVLNYGNADYDLRHSASFQYDWKIPLTGSNEFAKKAIEGWTVSGNLFYRGGYPVSIVNTNISVSNNTSYFLAAFGGGKQFSCAAKPDPTGTTNPVCFQKDTFIDATSDPSVGFGNIARNSFNGPHYFNTDMQLNKQTKLTEKLNLKIAANFFNLINHANFAPPANDLGSPDLGAIEGTVTPPSSPYGSFQGAAVSGRVVQLSGTFSF
jgi:hypothetical protein